MPRELGPFVARSLEILAREAPDFHHRLCTALAGRRIRVHSGAEAFSLECDKREIALTPPLEMSDLLLEASRPTILALAEGTLTLEDALLSGALELTGTVEHVLQFYDGLLIYAAGAVRCSQLSELLTTFRSVPIRNERY